MAKSDIWFRLHDASKGALTREGLTLKIAAASIAATIGSALANPADLVKGEAFRRPHPGLRCSRLTSSYSSYAGVLPPWESLPEHATRVRVDMARRCT